MKLINWLKNTFGKRTSVKEALDDFWDQLDNSTEQTLQSLAKQNFDEKQMAEAEELADKLFGGKIR